MKSLIPITVVCATLYGTYFIEALNAQAATKAECRYEGQYLEHETSCRKFYHCAHGKIEKMCPLGTIWDQFVLTCNHPSEVPDPSPAGCPDRDGGLSTHNTPSAPPKTSEELLNPADGLDDVDDPSDDFDDEMSRAQNEFSSSGNSVPVFKANKCERAGQYLPHETFCRKFYHCGHSQFEKECPLGTIWDQTILTCNYPYAVSSPTPSGCPDRNGTNSQSQLSSDDLQIPAESSQSSKSAAASSDPGSSGNPDASTAEQNPSTLSQGCPNADPSSASSSTTTLTSATNPSTPSDSPTAVANTSSVGHACPCANSVCCPPPPPPSNGMTANNSSSGTHSEAEQVTGLNATPDQCTKDGLYLPHERFCTRFYHCAHGRRLEKHCPAGTIWSVDAQLCNYADSVENPTPANCPDRNGESTAPPATISASEPLKASPEATASARCQYVGQYLAHERFCTKFYHCGHWPFEKSCGKGTIWDQTILGCNYPSQVARPTPNGCPDL